MDYLNQNFTNKNKNVDGAQVHFLHKSGQPWNMDHKFYVSKIITFSYFWHDINRPYLSKKSLAWEWQSAVSVSWVRLSLGMFGTNAKKSIKKWGQTQKPNQIQKLMAGSFGPKSLIVDEPFIEKLDWLINYLINF